MLIFLFRFLLLLLLFVVVVGLFSCLGVLVGFFKYGFDGYFVGSCLY